MTINRRSILKSKERNKLSPVGVLKEFSQESTLHGLRYISKDSSNVTDRLCWVAAILACTILAGFFVNWAWTKFSRSPIVVNVETTNYPLYKLAFPAITICPANNVKKTVGEKLLASYLNMTLDENLRRRLSYVLSGLSLFQYPFFYRVQPYFAEVRDLLYLLNNISLSDFMIKVLPTCKEMFRACYWIGHGVDCCSVFHIQRTEAGFCYSFNSLTSDNTKNCSAMDEFMFDDENKKVSRDSNCTPRHNIATGSATGLEVFMAKIPENESLGEGQMDPNGARILIHHPMSPPEAGKSLYMPEKILSTFSIKVSPTVTVSSSEVRNLALSTRNCIFPDEHHIEYFRTYTLQGCLIECRLNWLIDRCGCHPYYFDIKKDGVKECNITQMSCLLDENVNLRVYNAPPEYQNMNDGHDIPKLNCSNCLPTCHDSTFLMDYSIVPDTNSFTKDGIGHIDVYYNDLGAIKYHRERAFTLIQLIVSFGGIMSLFLGVSLLSGVEIIYYSIKLCKSIFTKFQQEEKQETIAIKILVSSEKVSGLKSLSALPPIQTDLQIIKT